MTTPADWIEELRALCDQLIDGTLSDEQQARIEQLVLEKPAARKWYTEYMHQHACLSWSIMEPGLLALTTPDLQKPTIAHDADGEVHPLVRPGSSFRDWRRVAILVLSTAAALLVGVWFGLAAKSTSPQPVVATLVDARGCTWNSGTLPTEVGAKLSAGRLQLADGLARIVFSSGAEISLEAPAELELVSAMRCTLHSGRLVAKVPPSAIGFVVETREAILEDLGTEFGVSVPADGTADVQVFDGLVDVKSKTAGKTHRVIEGNGLRIDTAGVTEYSAVEELPLAKADSVVEPAHDAHVVQITTAWGQGKDTYIQTTFPRDHTSDTLLLIKNVREEDSKYQRKAYLGFDLSSLKGQKIAEAQLKLAFEPTNMGFASRVPDARFAVYGVIDESLDDWSEETIRWENAPGNGPGGGDVDLNEVVLLGHFTVEQSVQRGIRTVSDSAIVEFLNRDTNGMATILVVRETVYGGRTSLVHGFANRHHPSAPPPTLKLTLVSERSGR